MHVCWCVHTGIGMRGALTDERQLMSAHWWCMPTYCVHCHDDACMLIDYCCLMINVCCNLIWCCTVLWWGYRHVWWCVYIWVGVGWCANVAWPMIGDCWLNCVLSLMHVLLVVLIVHMLLVCDVAWTVGHCTWVVAHQTCHSVCAQLCECVLLVCRCLMMTITLHMLMCMMLWWWFMHHLVIRHMLMLMTDVQWVMIDDVAATWLKCGGVDDDGGGDS